MNVKIEKDTRIMMNDREKKEFFKRRCPVCGLVQTPYMLEECFKITYYYKCFDKYHNTDIESIRRGVRIETEKGCGSKWKIKINPRKDFCKNKSIAKKSLVKKYYIKILKLIIKWCNK